LCHDDLYQTQNLNVSLSITNPGLSYTNLKMASQHARKAQALTFPKYAPGTSVTDNFPEILLHTDHVQVGKCAKASVELFLMPVNKLYHRFIAPTTLAIDPSSIDSPICVLSPSIQARAMVSRSCCCGSTRRQYERHRGIENTAQKRLKLSVDNVRVREPLWLYSIEPLGPFGLRGSDCLKISREMPG
jgi:hypothetical protein